MRRTLMISPGAEDLHTEPDLGEPFNSRIFRQKRRQIIKEKENNRARPFEKQ